MSLGYLEFFSIAVDCFQVLSGAVIVLLLMRYRKNSIKPDWPSRLAAGDSPFRHEFLIQSLKHQSEQSFDSVQKILLAERANLLRLFEIGDAHWSDSQAGPPADDFSHDSFQTGERETPDENDERGSGYQQVRQLAADGMTLPRIAKQLGIPRGEIELVLKMAEGPALDSDNPERVKTRLHRHA